jgi:hypothetical protein
MYVRALAIIVLVALVTHLVRRLRPSRFGLVFGLLLLYLPLHLRAPLNVLPMVNALTVCLGALILLIPTGSRQLGARAGSLRTVTFAFLALSMVGLALSLSAGEEAGDLLTLFKRWVDPVLFGLLALSLIRDGDRRFAVACVALGYAIVAAHAVREGFDYGSLKRIPGLLGQANETAAYLAMYAPIVLALALLFTHGGPRTALIASVAVAGWGLVFTESRGGMIGYGAGVLTVLLASRRTTLAMAGLALAAVVYAVPGILPERVMARFESTVVEKASAVDTVDDELEPSAASRIQQWTAGLKAMGANPVGVGFNRFKKVIGGFGGIKGLDAHNFFVLVGVESGIAGLALAAALIVKIGSNALAVVRGARDPFARFLGAGTLGMVLAAVVVNFFGSRLMQEQPSTYFWVLAAMTSRVADSLTEADPQAMVAGATPTRGWSEA